MDHMRVHDWEEWQTYRSDRGQPPWIKLHRRLMRDVKWVSLTDLERGQVVSIWLLAADHDGQVPADPELLRKLCYMSETPDLERFVELGLLEGDAPMVSERRQVDVNVTHQRKRKKQRKKRLESGQQEPDRFADFWDVYPRKVKKVEARKVWASKKLDAKADELIADVKERREKDRQWIDGFVPHPTTYLRGERWGDEIEKGVPAQNKPEWAVLPRDDDQLWNWAKQHGYPNPGQMTYYQYRRHLESCVEKRVSA